MVIGSKVVPEVIHALRVNFGLGWVDIDWSFVLGLILIVAFLVGYGWYKSHKE